MFYWLWFFEFVLNYNIRTFFKQSLLGPTLIIWDSTRIKLIIEVESWAGTYITFTLAFGIWDENSHNYCKQTCPATTVLEGQTVYFSYAVQLVEPTYTRVYQWCVSLLFWKRKPSPPLMWYLLMLLINYIHITILELVNYTYTILYKFSTENLFGEESFGKRVLHDTQLQ